MVIGLQAHVSQRVSALALTVNSLADTPHTADNGGGANTGDAILDGTETTNAPAVPTTCGTNGTVAAPTGPCTLRAAVYMANANGDTADTITFDASLSGTITLGTLTLPLGPCGADETAVPGSCGANGVVDDTIIDGPTAGPDPVITVDCAGGTPTVAFTVTGAGNTIRDLNIVGCSTAAIVITGAPADNNQVLGNDITSPNGADAIDIQGGGIANLVAGRIFRLVSPGVGDLPIDLDDNGVTINDAGDLDPGAGNPTCPADAAHGANLCHNYPVFAATSPTAGCARGSAGPFDEVRIYTKSTAGGVTTYEVAGSGTANVAGDFQICLGNTAQVTVVGTSTTTVASTTDVACSLNCTSEFSVTQQVVPAAATPTPGPVGGISLDPRLPGSSGGDAGLLAGAIAGAMAGAIALGGAVWYGRRRRMSR